MKDSTYKIVHQREFEALDRILKCLVLKDFTNRDDPNTNAALFLESIGYLKNSKKSISFTNYLSSRICKELEKSKIDPDHFFTKICTCHFDDEAKALIALHQKILQEIYDEIHEDIEVKFLEYLKQQGTPVPLN